MNAEVTGRRTREGMNTCRSGGGGDEFVMY